MSPTEHVRNATLLAWVGTALLAVQLDCGPLIPQEDRSQADHTEVLKQITCGSRARDRPGCDCQSLSLLISLCVVLVSFPGLYVAKDSPSCHYLPCGEG